MGYSKVHVSIRPRLLYLQVTPIMGHEINLVCDNPCFANEREWTRAEHSSASSEDKYCLLKICFFFYVDACMWR